MNSQQFIHWVSDPARTKAELFAAHTALALPALHARATRDGFRNALVAHAIAQPDVTQTVPPALATAIGVTAPPPTPPPAPTPAAAATPTATPTPNRFPFWVPAALAIALGIAVLFVGLLALKAFVWNDDGNDDKASASANATVTLVSQTSSTAQQVPNSATPAGTSGSGANTTGSGTNGTSSGTNGNTPTCPGDHVVNPNETYNVPPGCIVKGDVQVNGQQLYDDDPATGLLVSCPQGCTIMAPWGANVSPRTVDDLKSEMLSSGCGSSCTDVKVLVIENFNTQNSGVTATCRGEMKIGETRTLSAGCIIVGDVVVNNVLQKPVGRNRNDTGYVQKLESDTTVTAPWGAGVYDESWNVDDLVNTTKSFGCDQDSGCSGGVYDWEGQRLDQ